jgi:hypothetical protein
VGIHAEKQFKQIPGVCKIISKTFQMASLFNLNNQLVHFSTAF